MNDQQLLDINKLKPVALALMGIYASYKVLGYIGSQFRVGQRIFNRVWEYLAPVVDAKLHKNKESLFSQSTGKVLDVGSGFGATFAYIKNLQEVNELVSIEPNPFMMDALRRSAEKNQSTHYQTRILNKTIMGAINDGDIQPESFDTVICNLVLCSIPNVKQVLYEIQHVLKPGGKLIFIEHVGSKSFFSRSVQHCVDPVWGLVTDGCELSRLTDTTIQEMTGWDKVVIQEIPNHFLRHIGGYAIKK